MRMALLSTSRRTAIHFQRIRQELDSDDDLILDVIAWPPPREAVDDLVDSYTIVGPWKMPDFAAEHIGAQQSESTDPAANEELDGTPVPAETEAEAAEEAYDAHRSVLLETGSSPLSEVDRVRPTEWDLARIKHGIAWRIRKIKLITRRSRVGKLTKLLVKGGVSTQFWRRLRRRPDVLTLARHADLIIVLDASAIRVGWHLARMLPNTPVMHGVAAAAREAAIMRQGSPSAR